ncbi:MAG: hypothetical protein K0S57_3694 [Ramlibacter sp.]|jgi:hypothetical protein|nr:hypothetical protein [Ramlibacter sp.]
MKRLLCCLLLALPLLAAAQDTPARADCKPGDLPAAAYERRNAPLTERELAMARTAWKYFENNTQPTGLANAVDNYPSTTLWDTASYMAAITAARELGLITPQQGDARLARLVEALNKVSFFRNELPNKVYHTQTLEKVDYANKPGEIGFSALDLGRLLVWLKIVKERYPQHADGIDRFVLRWNFEHVVDARGMMFGAMLDKERKLQYVQEGRLGYEEYAARGFALWGFSTDLASQSDPYATAPIYCVEVPYDARDPRKFYQHNYVVSESYVLDGIEFDWDLTSDRDTAGPRHSHPWMLDFANRVYQAQENRFRATGILTARSEHQLEAEPYFVYDTVFTDGYPWNTITEDGKYVPHFAAVSLKAALGMWVLWKSEYTDRLFEAIATQSNPGKGFHEGILENGKGPIRAFTANNNGIMLEALLYKAQGRLLQWAPPRETLWDRTPTKGRERTGCLRPGAPAGGSPAC